MRKTWGCWRHLLGIALPALAGLVSSPGGAAATETLYNTGRILPQQDSACAGLADCRTVRLRPMAVEPGGSVAIPMECPADHPHLIGWDARRHEHISIRLVPSRAEGQLPRLVAGNNAHEAGSVTIFIGCSRQRHRVTAMMQSASAVPTNRAAVRRARAAEE